jgi:hypothetical protein
MNVTVVLTGDEDQPAAARDRASRAVSLQPRAPLSRLDFEDGDGDPRTPWWRAAAARTGAST